MAKSLIELVIEEMNKEFEYYFEDYYEIDNSDIWWYYDSKEDCIKHVANLCKKAGDLAIFYYQKGYCPLYVILLKKLFPEGKIYHSTSHMIFFYQGFFYDSSGKVNINPLDYEETPDDFKMQEFSAYFLYSEANLDILNLMYQKGLEILSDSKKRKKETSFL